jgi:hypothetical protein
MNFFQAEGLEHRRAAGTVLLPSPEQEMTSRLPEWRLPPKLPNKFT